MIIDGRAYAKDILLTTAAVVAALPTPPHVTVFTCAPNFETQKFLTIKKTQAAMVGVVVEVVELPQAVSLAAVRAAIEAATAVTDGIIIQFPFPHLATTDLIPFIPPEKDIDVLHYVGGRGALLPPVVGAIDYIARRHEVVFSGRNVVVIGNGRLVGRPAVAYAESLGAVVTLITKEHSDLTPLQYADIIILGAGVPGLMTASMVKTGVVVFDAGTSEEGGVLVGDAAPEVAEKASIFTPVPGGIGPLTVAILLKNVLTLATLDRKNK